MTVMTQKQEAVLRDLVLLADGDSDLVWEAIRTTAQGKESITLQEVATFILDRLKERKTEQPTDERAAAAR